MAQISRKLGTTSEKLNVFINDATVSTGAGLANIVASSVSFGWFRDDMAAVSTGTCTTGTLGTYTVSSFVQASSTGALGWYQFDVPDGVFVSGRKASIHLSGAPSMAPLPILIELTGLDNQTAISSQTISTFLSGNVGVSTGVGVSSFTINVGVSSVTAGVNVTSFNGAAAVTTAAGIISTDMRTILGTTPVTTTAGILDVNIKNVVGTAAVTTSAGIQAYVFDLGRTANNNSTVAFSSMSISSQSVTVGGVNVTSIAGSPPVTTSAGVLSVGPVGVSSLTLGVNVTSIVGTAAITTSAGILAYTFDLGRTTNNNSTVSFSSMSISSQSVTIGGVNVTSVMGSSPVTSSAGVLVVTGSVNASTVSGVVTTSVNSDKTGYSLTAGEEAAIADALLGRNVSGGSSTGRLVKEAFHAIRNKVDLSAGVVYLTDDVTSSWTFTASTQAGNPLVSVDPT